MLTIFRAQQTWRLRHSALTARWYSRAYAAMVYAGLPATERHAHSLPVDYLPAGLDATIAGSYLDLKFTNTFSQPLLIQASANGGTLTVTLVLQ